MAVKTYPETHTTSVGTYEKAFVVAIVQDLYLEANVASDPKHGAQPPI